MVAIKTRTVPCCVFVPYKWTLNIHRKYVQFRLSSDFWPVANHYWSWVFRSSLQTRASGDDRLLYSIAQPWPANYCFASPFFVLCNIFVCLRACLQCMCVCMLASWQIGFSCRRETVRIDGQWLWDRTVKFARWQHHAGGCGDKICRAWQTY